MGPPPTTFDEGAIKNWLGKMSVEDLQKLARLTEIAKQGKQGGKAAWSKVDQGLKQQAVHVEVHGGNVTVNNSVTQPPRGQGPAQRGLGAQSADWGRRLARIKDFING